MRHALTLKPRNVGDIAAWFTRRVRTRPARLGGAAVITQLRSAPVEIGGARVTQVDQTTCGSACLLMLAATGDPRLMRWLETGECDGALPPEAPPGRYPDASERIAAAQRHIQRRSSYRALGLARWPKSLGTPPWAVARDARFPGVRYVHRAADDRGARGEQLTSQLVNALRRGYPVLLYTGGDTSGGATKALPRHVVLAVPGMRARITPDGEEVVSIYEPSAGLVHEVRASELRNRTSPHPALGHWTHIQWLCLPVPATTEGKP